MNIRLLGPRDYKKNITLVSEYKNLHGVNVKEIPLASIRLQG